MKTIKRQIEIGIVMLFLFMGAGLLDAKANQELTFSPDVYAVDLDLPRPSGWKWDGAPDYKNERLLAYQKMLKARGIKDHEALKLLTAQIVQENGSLSENVHGENGCSVGVLQYNACVHHKQSAKAFLESHPEWKSWEYQFERMADMVANRMDIYDGDLRLVVIHHNCPACAKRGVDSKAGYYRSVKSRTNLLISL